MEAVEFLLSNGASVYIKDDTRNTPLHSILLNESVDPKIVELFLQKGFEIKTRNRHQKTMLDIAREKGHTEIVKILEEAEAKQNNAESDPEPKSESKPEKE